MTTPTIITELNRVLSHDIELRVVGDAVEVVEVASRSVFPFDAGARELAKRAVSLNRSGTKIGVGGEVSPGAALLSIHIDEAIATAEATHTRLALGRGGIYSK